MIGVSSTHFSQEQVEDTIAKVASEFKHWEIFAEAEHDLQKISARLEVVRGSYDLSYSVHAPIGDTNLAGLSERMRESSVLEMIALMERMAELGITMMTVHPGYSSLSIPGQELKALRQSKTSMRTLDRASREYGIAVAVENMPNIPIMLGRTAEQLADIVDGTELGICFDRGHANTTGQTDAMIDTFGKRIINIHIHDNNGDKDDHMTIGDGGIDFEKVLRRLGGYKGNYIIESKGIDSAVKSKAALESVFSRF
jgi:sugar phosphate isomerase/epimerase